jgi:flagellar biosynthesis/type III secretory pathway protein FliH
MNAYQTGYQKGLEAGRKARPYGGIKTCIMCADKDYTRDYKRGYEKGWEDGFRKEAPPSDLMDGMAKMTIRKW